LPFAGLTANRKHDDQMVGAVQVWIAENYSNPIPVSTMAARSGLTERGFLRRFRKATGLSPMEYVQALRIEEAKQLLETSDMPLDEIATEVGYVEPASFRRLFRKMVGISPSSYRRRRLPFLSAPA
jgi:transcriptional regulator GlxA family with amidase domain